MGYTVLAIQPNRLAIQTLLQLPAPICKLANTPFMADTTQIAARSGVDLVAYFHLKEHANASKILAALHHHTAFRLSFALAFALSAFMSF